MRRVATLLLIFSVLIACEAQQEVVREEPLLPAETFRWCDQPVTFQPPPAKWERSKLNQGGLRGVWFTHVGSVGERIYVSEYYKVGERSRRNNHLLTYTIDDVVDEVRFSTEGWPLPADSFVIEPIQPDTVAGVRAYSLDFTLNAPERMYVGREYYFLKNNCLFAAAYLGQPENMPLFERVVATISLRYVDAP